jgi:hypothetical protein
MLRKTPRVALLATPVAPRLVYGEILLWCLMGVGVDEPIGGILLPSESNLTSCFPDPFREDQATPLIESPLT